MSTKQRITIRKCRIHFKHLAQKKNFLKENIYVYYMNSEGKINGYPRTLEKSLIMMFLLIKSIIISFLKDILKYAAESLYLDKHFHVSFI